MQQKPHAGAPVVHGSERGHPTPNPPDAQADPLAEWVSQSMRKSIYAAREAAHQRACDCWSLDAGQVSHIASQFAAPWAFNARASEQELESVLAILTDLLRAADAIEQLEARHA